MKSLLKLTKVHDDSIILIGVESIICIKEDIIANKQGTKTLCTAITSREAMATTNWVRETPDQIYDMYIKD